MSEGTFDVQQLLEAMPSLGASDLHLTVGSPPMYRINGDLRPVDLPPIKPDQTEEAMLNLTPPGKRTLLDEIGTCDFSFAIPGVARYRINVYHQRGSIALAVRQVHNEVPTIESLNLPPIVAKIADNQRGLILVTGVTGSGKTSTLAAMIGHINKSRRSHIITIEDPIEFLHQHDRSIVNQIELGVDTRDLNTALKHVLRQDPDVILFGELRDQEAVKTALAATETGHLVLATLHTSDARKTINRILNLFDSESENQLLQELSLHMRAIVSQRLVRRADKKGRIAAIEVLINISIVAKLIAENRIEDLKQVIQNGEHGMQSFNHALVALVRRKTIAMEEALKYCEDIATFKRQVSGRYSEGDRRAIVG